MSLRIFSIGRNQPAPFGAGNLGISCELGTHESGLGYLVAEPLRNVPSRYGSAISCSYLPKTRFFVFEDSHIFLLI